VKVIGVPRGSNNPSPSQSLFEGPKRGNWRIDDGGGERFEKCIAKPLSISQHGGQKNYVTMKSGGESTIEYSKELQKNQLGDQEREKKRDGTGLGIRILEKAMKMLPTKRRSEAEGTAVRSIARTRRGPSRRSGRKGNFQQRSRRGAGYRPCLA